MVINRFLGSYTSRLIDWILIPYWYCNITCKWPWWLRALVALGLLYFLEEVFVSSIGYTIYHHRRMDFS